VAKTRARERSHVEARAAELRGRRAVLERRDDRPPAARVEVAEQARRDDLRTPTGTAARHDQERAPGAGSSAEAWCGLSDGADIRS
jgi:hypothetical protein